MVTVARAVGASSAGQQPVWRPTGGPFQPNNTIKLSLQCPHGVWTGLHKHALHVQTQPHDRGFCYTTIQISGLVAAAGCLSRESWSVPPILEHLITAQMNNADRPVLSIRTRGWRTASSSLLCRQSSSSYSRIVLSNSPNISSAAAVSRWLTKSLTLWTLDMVENMSK